METEGLNIVISLKHTFYADKIHRSTFQKIEDISIVLLRRTWRPICEKKLLAEVQPIHAEQMSICHVHDWIHTL